MKCSEVMTVNPSCCLVTDTVRRAAELMKSEDVAQFRSLAIRKTGGWKESLPTVTSS